MHVDMCFWVCKPIVLNRVILQATWESIPLMKVHHSSWFSLLELVAESALRIRFSVGSWLQHTCALRLAYSGLGLLFSFTFALVLACVFVLLYLKKIYPKLDLVLYLLCCKSVSNHLWHEIGDE